MAIYSSYFDFTLEDAVTALEYINPNLPYKDWANIGRALAAEFGESAEDAFLDWSATSDTKEKKSSTRSQWKSFLKSRSVNISTLIYHAKQAGWNPDKKEKIPEHELVKRKKQREKIRVQRQQQTARISAQKLKRTEQFYNQIPALEPNQEPSPYQVDKFLQDAEQYSEFKAFHSHKRQLLVIPFYDIQGNWSGAEIIYAWKKTRHHKTGKLRHFRRTLTGTKPDQGFHVFPNHSALKTAKRVFLMEGWAKSLWSHKATGEVTIHVVGAHNIPTIAKLIERHHPHIQVIAAPDNDKAGNDVITAHNGFWTQPLIDGDWDDLAIQQGVDALKAQLLNIRGFMTNNVESRYLGDAAGIKIMPGVNAIKSAKETGKSTWIIDFINQNPDLSVLVVSYRKNLIASLAKDAGVDFYDDMIIRTRFGLSNEMLKRSRRLAISPDSIYKLIEKGGSPNPYDIIFIDECEQTLGHFNAETMQHKELNANVTAWLLKHSKYQILADADLGQMTLDYCRKIGLNHGQLITNTFKPRQGSIINLFGHHYQLRDQMVAKILQGERVFYCSNSKNRLLEVEQMLLNAGVSKDTIRTVHSGNSGQTETQEFIKNINDQVSDLHVLMASPSMGTGVSIKQGHPFETVYAEFSHRSGTAEQAHQQMARARGITEYNVWVDTAVNNFDTDPNHIRQVMLDMPEQDAANLFTFDIEKGEMVAKDELYEWLYCHNLAFINLNRNCFAIRFLQQAENEGYTINNVPLDKTSVMVTADKLEDIRLSLDEDLHNRLYDHINHPILTDEQFAEAELGQLQISEESILKTRVFKSLNLANYARFPSILAPEKLHNMVAKLAYLEANNKFVSGLKKLSVVATDTETTVLRDIENRKFAKSRAGLKHYSAQRRHELRLLKAVGIDENLNYDGKEWRTKDVKQKLANYLAQHKDEIQAYSGSTITPKTLKDPIRWFTDHLRSLNVPLVAYQKRVNGKQTWFRKVDTEQWAAVKRLVRSRVNGLSKHYRESSAELLSATVTREANNYINNNCPHVTDNNSYSPVFTPSSQQLEKARKHTNPAPDANTTTMTETPFDKFIRGLNKFGTNGERQKLAQAFPESHREQFNKGGIPEAEMRDWLEYGASGRFKTAVFNVARSLMDLLPGDVHPAKEVMSRLTATHAKLYCSGKLTIQELANVVKNYEAAGGGG